MHPSTEGQKADTGEKAKAEREQTEQKASDVPEKREHSGTAKADRAPDTKWTLTKGTLFVLNVAYQLTHSETIRLRTNTVLIEHVRSKSS